MLGRLEMSIEECEKEYEEISKQVFDRHSISQMYHYFTRTARYSSGIFTESVKEVIKKELGSGSEDALMIVDEKQSGVGRKCKV